MSKICRRNPARSGKESADAIRKSATERCQGKLQRLKVRCWNSLAAQWGIDQRGDCRATMRASVSRSFASMEADDSAAAGCGARKIKRRQN